MALRAACVDRARPLVEEATSVRVRGETRFELVPGEWFRCRLTLPAGPERPDAVTFRRTVVKTPSLLYITKDVAGDLVELSNEMRLEVDSKELGRMVWDVTSDPEPLRRKRKIIGWETSLRRVLDAELPDAEVA